VGKGDMVADVADSGGGGRLSDLAYNRILENLFDRRLPVGAFVSQNHLVELLGVPVAPLRDALRVLEAEGILTIQPRSGIQFVKPGLELTRSTYQFRGIIERAAVAVFAETADETELADIRRRHEAVIAALESDGLTEALKLESEELELLLHNAIIGSLNNPLIESSYRRMHNYLRLVRLDRRLTVPVALRSLKEHVAIIEACERRDTEGAVAALSAHFNAALNRHMGMY
jgi:DNA-binding GntR family transcriptional regulator